MTDDEKTKYLANIFHLLIADGVVDRFEDRVFDVNQAKQLLHQAADEDGFDLPLSLELFFMQQPRPYMQQPRQIAVFIRDALEPIGIKVQLVTNDYQQHFQRLSAGEHDLGLAGWTSDNSDPDNFLFSLFLAYGSVVKFPVQSDIAHVIPGHGPQDKPVCPQLHTCCHSAPPATRRLPLGRALRPYLLVFTDGFQYRVGNICR